MMGRVWPGVGVIMCLASSGVEAQIVLSPPMDTTSLADGPYAHMNTLLEKTIFKVDVLTLDVRFGAEQARRFESLVSGNRYSSALADSAARIAIHSDDALAEIVFKRGVSLGQFVDGIREDLGKARKAGIISEEDYRGISESLPIWFGFLDERGIKEDDRILYRIRGDTLRTVFVGVGGDVPLDQVDVEPSAPRAVLGSYYAPGSSFRKGLLRSLFANEED